MESTSNDSSMHGSDDGVDLSSMPVGQSGLQDEVKASPPTATASINEMAGQHSPRFPVLPSHDGSSFSTDSSVQNNLVTEQPPSAISTVEAAGGRAQPPSPSPPPPPPPPPLLFSAADSVSNIAYEEKHAVIVCPPPICEELEQTHLGFALVIKADNPCHAMLSDSKEKWIHVRCAECPEIEGTIVLCLTAANTSLEDRMYKPHERGLKKHRMAG